MSGKVLSLDIQKAANHTIDLARILPLSEVAVVRHRSTDDTIDDMSIFRGDVDVFEIPTIHISRFSHFEALDISHPQIFSRRSARGKRRKRLINLVKPLYIPYGSLDVRLMRKIPNKKKYSDLFVRPLSRSLMIRRQVKQMRKFLKKNRRGFVGVLTSAIILSAPILWYVKFSLEDGYAKFLSLPTVTHLDEAKKVVASARNSFERAHFLFAPFSWIPLHQVDMAKRASLGGLALARASDTLLSIVPTSTGGNIVEENTTSSLYREKSEDIYFFRKIGVDSPTDWIRDNRSDLLKVKDQIQQASQLYLGVSGEGEIAEKVHRVGSGLAKVSSYLSWYFDHEEYVLTMLGDSNPTRYMVLNQNRDEIRANGGFPGTVMTFTLYKGNVLDYRKDDVYYYDWNLYPYKEQPPPGLALLTDNYGLRDVNYYPDFRDTVEKANSFIERSGDSTITTGIAIHQGLIEDVLEELGPVTVSGVSIPFDSKNFSALMSTLVEAQYGRDLHAKTILFDFVNAFAKKIHETKKYDVLFDVVERYWKNGEILIASRDKDTDEFIAQYRKKLPWECQDTPYNTGLAQDDATGSLVSDMPNIEHQKQESCSRNWAYPIFTSVGGNKSDRYIKREYSISTKKGESCVYENSLTIKNVHTFSSSDRSAIKAYIREFKITDISMVNKVNFVEGDSPNKSFVRIYVPVGSMLLSPGGSIKSEMGDHATVFSFMLETPVGGSASKTIHYTTQIPYCNDYDNGFEWYRQPGLREVITK